MKTMNVNIFEPGDVFAVSGGAGLEFYRITRDGGITAIEPTPITALPAPEEGIEILNLSVRPYNVLKREGIHTIGDLLAYWGAHGEDGLGEMRNMGEIARREVVGKILDLKGAGDG